MVAALIGSTPPQIETTKEAQETKQNELKNLKKTLKQTSDEIAKARVRGAPHRT